MMGGRRGFSWGKKERRNYHIATGMHIVRELLYTIIYEILYGIIIIVTINAVILQLSLRLQIISNWGSKKLERVSGFELAIKVEKEQRLSIRKTYRLYLLNN